MIFAGLNKLSDKKTLAFKSIWRGDLLPMSYNSTTKSQGTDWIFKLTLIHAFNDLSYFLN